VISSSASAPSSLVAVWSGHASGCLQSEPRERASRATFAICEVDFTCAAGYICASGVDLPVHTIAAMLPAA
jgi:hypothetical protein